MLLSISLISDAILETALYDVGVTVTTSAAKLSKYKTNFFFGNTARRVQCSHLKPLWTPVTLSEHSSNLMFSFVRNAFISLSFVDLNLLKFQRAPHPGKPANYWFLLSGTAWQVFCHFSYSHFFLPSQAD